jgi:glycine betaine/proline transport system permease protein
MAVNETCAFAGSYKIPPAPFVPISCPAAAPDAESTVEVEKMEPVDRSAPLIQTWRRLWSELKSIPVTRWLWVAVFITWATTRFIDPPWMAVYPEDWVLPFKDLLNRLMDWLINDLSFGVFTFKELTRSLAWLLEWPMTWALGVFATGVDIATGGGQMLHIPHLPWIAVVVLAAIIGHAGKGWNLALMAGSAFVYLAVFGQWESAMMTLAAILISVAIGALAGLAIGIVTAGSRRVEAWVLPLLDLMQTVPVFAYLIPILFLFGFGPVSAMIATIIYATPPMVRCTMLGLRATPPEIVESGQMIGCTPRQLLWKVKIPAALSELMVGLNQVIMLSLNMVIIASMIGAGGLGYDVLAALRRLKIGAGLESGIAIVVMAIVLDRLSQAFAHKAPVNMRDASFFKRNAHALLAVAVIPGAYALGTAFPALMNYPEAWQVTTGPFWDAMIKYINIHCYDQLEWIRSGLLLTLLMPFKRFLIGLPWLGVIMALGLIAYRLKGIKLAALVVALAGFIAVTGFWEKAMITVYLCGIGVMLSTVIGLIIGVWATKSNSMSRVINIILDTLQTLPSFVYLMPVVMLFRVGDVSALIAIVAYAVVPAIRYTVHGILSVPATVREAAVVSGCTPGQTFWKVELPLALPDIMLGINQTVMLALSMVVITALVGTRDLGQEVYIALTRADNGLGLSAGLGVAFIATIADRLIQGWTESRRSHLGAV